MGLDPATVASAPFPGAPLRSAVTELIPSQLDGIVPQAHRATAEELAKVSSAGMVLPPGAAQSLRDTANLRPARSALARVGGRRDAWTVVLDPTNDTRKKIEAGDLVLTKTKKGGQLLAQARDPKTGQIAENVRIREAAAAGKGAKAAKAATAGAAVAWQSMAIATQQHYLVEISGKLSALERGVSEIIEREIEARAAGLQTTVDALALVESHIESGDPLDSNDRQNVATWHKEARAVHLAAADRAQKVLDDSGRDPAQCLPDLVLADHAARVAARCAATLLRMPFETEDKRLKVFWHYADLTDEAIEMVNGLLDRLDDELSAALTAWRQYVMGRPAERRKRAWNATGGRAIKHVGPRKPRFDGLRELPSAQKEWIRSRAEAGRDGPEAVAATVVLDEGGVARLLPA